MARFDYKTKYADCIRNSGNVSFVSKPMMMDNAAFNADILKMSLDGNSSPKFNLLIDKIRKLDEIDMKKSKHKFKHIIFSDLNSSNYGIKFIASALSVSGFVPGFTNSHKLVKPDGKGNSFGVLSSKTFAAMAMSAAFKKSVIERFNSRPDNVHGDLMRILVLDQGFREGIDLFDVKYIHLFEPMTSLADEKQAIGRATRFCGQKGLKFMPNAGWPLYVFRYDVYLPYDDDGRTFSNRYMEFININVREVKFASELEDIVSNSSIDKDLVKMGEDGNKLKNGCVENKKSVFKLNETQKLIRKYFVPTLDRKGMLLYHSVGTGKTCSAIATTESFEKAGYTILWVTRHTLKADLWKNMYGTQSCRKDGGNGKKFPASWIKPVSFKQFTNMLLKKNVYYDQLVKRNGEVDPLNKTLVIIDEAHKLYSDLTNAAEKPNMDIFEKMIRNSYKRSGKDSVRLLLMTATPFTNSGMEMIKLINLLKENRGLPDDFDAFSKVYLNDAGGFTTEGGKKIQKDFKGYISYLNKTKDARTFAQPIIEDVIGHASMIEDRELNDLRHELDHIKMTKYSTEFSNILKKCKEDIEKNFLAKKNKLNEDKEKKMEECKGVGKGEVTKCKAGVKSEFKELEATAKENRKRDIEECGGKKDLDKRQKEIEERVADHKLFKQRVMREISAYKDKIRSAETIKERREYRGRIRELQWKIKLDAIDRNVSERLDYSQENIVLKCNRTLNAWIRRENIRKGWERWERDKKVRERMDVEKRAKDRASLVGVLKEYYMDAFDERLGEKKPINKSFISRKYHPDKLPVNIKDRIAKDDTNVGKIYSERVFDEVMNIIKVRGLGRAEMVYIVNDKKKMVGGNGVDGMIKLANCNREKCTDLMNTMLDVSLKKVMPEMSKAIVKKDSKKLYKICSDAVMSTESQNLQKCSLANCKNQLTDYVADLEKKVGVKKGMARDKIDLKYVNDINKKNCKLYSKSV